MRRGLKKKGPLEGRKRIFLGGEKWGSLRNGRGKKDNG